MRVSINIFYALCYNKRDNRYVNYFVIIIALKFLIRDFLEFIRRVNGVRNTASQRDNDPKCSLLSCNIGNELIDVVLSILKRGQLLQCIYSRVELIQF